MKQMRRGLKSELKENAASLREEMGLKSSDPIDCFKVCAYLSIDFYAFGDLLKGSDDLNGALQALHDNRSGSSVSAVMVERGVGHVIVYNETHSRARIQNSIIHELSHYFLGHKTMLCSFGQDDFKRGDSKAEDLEADYFGGCLLIPRTGLVYLCKKKYTLEQIAAHFKVSVQLARMRYNLTGMKRQFGFAK